MRRLRFIRLSMFLTLSAVLTATAPVGSQNVFDEGGPDPGPQPGASAPAQTAPPAKSAPAAVPVTKTPVTPTTQQAKTGGAPASAKNQKPANSKAAAAAKAKADAATAKAKATAARQAAMEQQQFLDSASGGASQAPANPQSQAIRPDGRNLGHFPWLVQSRTNPGYTRVAPGHRAGKRQPGHYIKPAHVPLPNPYGHQNTVIGVRPKAAPKPKPTKFVPTLMYEMPYNRLPPGGDLKPPETQPQQAAAEKRK